HVTIFNCFFEITGTIVSFGEIIAYPDANQNIQALKYRPVKWFGNLYSSIGEIDSAIFYLRKAYDWYDKNGYLYWSMYVSNDLGKIYSKNSEMDIAENYYLQSERIFNEMIANNSFYRYDSLKYVANFGLELYFPFPYRQLHEMMWTQCKSMYYNLYQISEGKKCNEALKYHIAYFNAVDTLNKLQRNREIIELQTKYETERKEEQIVSLSQENTFQEFKLKQSGYFLLGLGGVVLLVVILAIVLIRQNKLREQQKNLLLQQKLFRSQMNPHFIFNSLASIQNFVVRQDSKKASIYLSRFSELVRSILDSSTEEYILFEKEVKTIKNYLELQKVRFPDKFDYTIEIDERIDPENMLIPPMLTQPFIENSIEHGFKHKKAVGNLKIRFTIKSKLIVFEIEDDGIGRAKALEIGIKLKKDHKSMATDITRERLMVLKRKLKQKISLIIIDLKNENNEPSGTKVVFDIPFKYV
nr:histidine kinase [Bacteroidota bacterium]